MGIHRVPRAEGRTPGGQGDRFPGFDALAEVATWDMVTAGVVLARVGPQPPLRFFNLDEEAIAVVLLDHLLDQRDDPRVPVLEMIDARLADGQTDGWRYADMPEDGHAWRLTLHALDDDARERFGNCLPELAWPEQGHLIESVRLRKRQWHGMPPARVWSLWTRYAAAAFYAHPWAWNEIGFGGPAYPRGYKNFGMDSREPWEVPDAHPDRDPVLLTRQVEETRREAAQRIDNQRAGNEGAEGQRAETPGERQGAETRGERQGAETRGERQGAGGRRAESRP